jgi:hypothetical protein
MAAIRHIEHKMAKNVKASSSVDSTSSTSTKEKNDTSKKPKAAKCNWRTDEKYFTESSSSRVFQKGLENYSAGWLAQGHEVCEPIILLP